MRTNSSTTKPRSGITLSSYHGVKRVGLRPDGSRYEESHTLDIFRMRVAAVLTLEHDGVLHSRKSFTLGPITADRRYLWQRYLWALRQDRRVPTEFFGRADFHRLKLEGFTGFPEEGYRMREARPFPNVPFVVQVPYDRVIEWSESEGICYFSVYASGWTDCRFTTRFTLIK